jgi:hypothetical protein
MTRKRTMSSKKAPTDEELFAEIEDIRAQSASKPAQTAGSRQSKQTSVSGQSEQDLFAELNNQLTQRPASRPGTPALRSTTAASGNRSPKRTSTATPPPGGRSSEEKSVTGSGQRKSGESARSFHQIQTVFTPATTTTEESPEPEPAAAPVSSGGSWWGGLLSTATAAVSQAQAAVKDLQKNEEAQKWAEQVRGNVGVLRGFGKRHKRLVTGFY